jgi:3-methyl-2-oxobutanoate hydroxymethyltransferase
MSTNGMRAKTTAPVIARRKRSSGDPPIVMVTAYDTPFARTVDEAGVDAILVGDSVAENVLGLSSTLQVTVEEMRHHVAAVARAEPAALVVADLPWMSYHVDIPDTLRNAALLIRAGAEAVKLEGGRRRLPVVQALIHAEIPVMGHLGLTPQSVNAMGGLRVQGKDFEAATAIELDAKSLADAGCFAIVLEGVPDVLANRITASIPVPTIGIGAGAGCDGQVLVLHDIIGLSGRTPAKFVRQYVDVRTVVRDAVSAFASDVRSGAFPSDAETYHGSKALTDALSGN